MKGQSRMFFLRRLRSSNVCTRLLRMGSLIVFTVLCWGGGIRTCGANTLGKLVRKASSVVGVELDSVEAVTEKRMRGKLKDIMDDPCHPFYAKLRWLKRMISHRLTRPHASRDSLVPSAIRLHNITASSTSYLH